MKAVQLEVQHKSQCVFTMRQCNRVPGNDTVGLHPANCLQFWTPVYRGLCEFTSSIHPGNGCFISRTMLLHSCKQIKWQSDALLHRVSGVAASHNKRSLLGYCVTTQSLRPACIRYVVKYAGDSGPASRQGRLASQLSQVLRTTHRGLLRQLPCKAGSAATLPHSGRSSKESSSSSPNFAVFNNAQHLVANLGRSWGGVALSSPVAVMPKAPPEWQPPTDPSGPSAPPEFTPPRDPGMVA